MGLFSFKKQISEEEKRAQEAQKIYQQGLLSVKDIIAPSAIELAYDYIRVSGKFVRTYFVYAYPRYLYTNWLSPIVNIDAEVHISMFIYPVDSRIILENLRRKSANLEADMTIEAEKGKVRNPVTEATWRDVEELRDKIATGQCRFFRYALYFAIYADSLEELEDISKKLETMLGGSLIYIKPAHIQMEQGFNSTIPLGKDELFIVRNMDTYSLSTTFPFVSAELTSNEGVLYGVNLHNNTLVIFDRFSLENANSVVFAKAGAGKSYAVKLEALRSLMLGTDIIIIDPEGEYEPLARAVGGKFFDISLNSDKRINPFDLPKVFDEEEGPNALKTNIINLLGLLNLMLGGNLSPEEVATLERALYQTYALKDITEIPTTHGNPPPIMEDLYNVLSNMEGTNALVKRLERYVKGTFAGLFNQPTNIDLDNPFVVFSIKNLEDALRPIAIYIIANFIWNKVKSELKKRILIIDEAWWLMQYEDSARFLFGLAKRSRKYYLGLTTITQDVEDFLESRWGKAIITNSSIQLLLKQSPAAIDKLAEIFKLTQGEKMFLLNCQVGTGLFFAGASHVAIGIISSYAENQLITTSPKEILEIRAAKKEISKPKEISPTTTKPSYISQKKEVPSQPLTDEVLGEASLEEFQNALNKNTQNEATPKKEGIFNPQDQAPENITQPTPTNSERQSNSSLIESSKTQTTRKELKENEEIRFF